MQPFIDAEKDRTEISVNKPKQLLLFLILVIIALGYPAVMVRAYIVDENSPETTFFVALGGFLLAFGVLIFCGYCAVIIFFQLLNDKPAFVISKTGLTVNFAGTAIGIGEIPWLDVTNITVYKGHELRKARPKWICLIVHNPDDYIGKQSDEKQRLEMIRSFEVCGTSIAISGTGLNVSFDELLKIVNEYYAMSRQ